MSLTGDTSYGSLFRLKPDMNSPGTALPWC